MLYMYKPDAHIFLDFS